MKQWWQYALVSHPCLGILCSEHLAAQRVPSSLSMYRTIWSSTSIFTSAPIASKASPLLQLLVHQVLDSQWMWVHAVVWVHTLNWQPCQPFMHSTPFFSMHLVLLERDAYSPLLPCRMNEKDARRVRPLDRRLVPVKKFADWAAEHKNELLDSLKQSDAAQH